MQLFEANDREYFQRSTHIFRLLPKNIKILIDGYGLADGTAKSVAEISRTYGVSRGVVPRQINNARNMLALQPLLRDIVLEEVK